MDIRSEATRNRIKLALIKCMKDTPYADVPNLDIINNAGVSSRTFYKHYSGKDQILKEIEDELIAGFKEANKKDREAVFQIKQKLTSEENIRLAETEFKHLIDFCDSAKDIIQILLSSNGDINFLNKIHAMSVAETTRRLNYLIDNNLLEISNNAMIPADMVFNLNSEVIINTIITWIRDDSDLTPHDMRHILGIVQIKSPTELLSLLKK